MFAAIYHAGQMSADFHLSYEGFDAAKLPGAGISLKLCPGKCAAEKAYLPKSVGIRMRSRLWLGANGKLSRVLFFRVQRVVMFGWHIPQLLLLFQSVPFLQIPDSLRDLTQPVTLAYDRCYLSGRYELAHDGQVLFARSRNEHDELLTHER
jgi:hypothetical protein